MNAIFFFKNERKRSNWRNLGCVGEHEVPCCIIYNLSFPYPVCEVLDDVLVFMLYFSSQLCFARCRERACTKLTSLLASLFRSHFNHTRRKLNPYRVLPVNLSLLIASLFSSRWSSCRLVFFYARALCVWGGGDTSSPLDRSVPEEFVNLKEHMMMMHDMQIFKLVVPPAKILGQKYALTE